jgi:hypothetical protein
VTLSPEQVRQEITDFKQHYEFDKLVTLLNQSGDEAPEELGKIGTYQKLNALQHSVAISLGSTSAGNPLSVSRLDGVGAGGSAISASIYMAGPTLTIQTDQGAIRPNWGDLTPLQYLEIANAAVTTPGLGGTHSSQLPDYIQLFSNEYNVTVPQ